MFTAKNRDTTTTPSLSITEQISHLVPVFLLLTLSKQMGAIRDILLILKSEENQLET